MIQPLPMTDAQKEQLELEWEVATQKIERLPDDVPERDAAILIAQGFLRPVARHVPDARETMLRFQPYEALAAVIAVGEGHVDLDDDLVVMLREHNVTWAEVALDAPEDTARGVA